MITRRAAAAGLATSLIGLTGRTGAQGLSPTSSVSRVLQAGEARWSLAAKPRSMRLRPDAAREADVWTFNGELAPVFRLKHGAGMRLSLKNETALPLSLHFHGIRGPNEMAGVGGLTQPPIAPGESFDYAFTPPDPGTFLIRPCLLGGSAEPAERGLTSLLIVEEAQPPQVDRDIALIVDDWALAEDGSLALGDPAPAGRLGSFLTVNGKATPLRIEAPPRGRIRLRFANACNARGMRLRFDGLKAFVIAVDGQPSSTFEPLEASLPFAPGNRYDLLVDLPAEVGPAGSVIALIGSGFPLMEIVATGDRSGPLPPMAPLRPNPKLPAQIRLQDAMRKDVAIRGDPTRPDVPWAINGATGQPSNPPLVRIKRGTPVVLALRNETAFMQPMHLHGHSSRLLHGLDDGWEPYWLDTVQVPENKTVRIAFVADNPGKWLLASTVMERFDAGLWTWIEVT
ncbi:multicopper oxidase domain-containing protein [Microvirga makkahensis]|uniref:Multicopper oxidase domain-containing protein n=2 Tax=Microvirga makkahensis TaxID=1128670 RepID=A0A7X3SPN8_9HYPH|nr:multicopper oxidase domain-containing protein [Microvirga makkahensis]